MGRRMEDLQGRKRNRIHVPPPRKSLYFTHINCSDSEAKKSSPKSNLYLCCVRKRRIRMVLLLHLQTSLTTLSFSFDNSVSQPKCLGAISLSCSFGFPLVLVPFDTTAVGSGNWDDWCGLTPLIPIYWCLNLKAFIVSSGLGIHISPHILHVRW